MLSFFSRRRERGFTLIELSIVLAVSATLFSGLWRLMSSGSAQLRDQTVATQQVQVISAAKTFLASASGQSWLMSQTATRALALYLPTASGSCSNNPCLADYLPSGFTKTGTANAYGQTFQDVMVNTATHDTTSVPHTYSFMVATTGGETIPDTAGSRIASLIGGDGGFIYSNTDICSASSSDRALTACGAYGAWSALTTSTYGVASSSGGHVASRTYISSDQDALSPWLSRLLLSGNTAYNTMMTDLYMTGSPFNIFMAASTSGTGGAIFLRGGCISGTSQDCGGTPSTNAVGGRIENIAEAFIGSSASTLTTAALTVSSASGVALSVQGDQDVTGTLHAATFLYGSDARMKENIKPLEKSLEKLSQLRPVAFTFKESGKPSMGFIAQELEKIYPGLVKNLSSGYKGVDYMGLVGPLVASVQELQTENAELRDRLTALEAVVQKLAPADKK